MRWAACSQNAAARPTSGSIGSAYYGTAICRRHASGADWWKPGPLRMSSAQHGSATEFRCTSRLCWRLPGSQQQSKRFQNRFLPCRQPSNHRPLASCKKARSTTCWTWSLCKCKPCTRSCAASMLIWKKVRVAQWAMPAEASFSLSSHGWWLVQKLGMKAVWEKRPWAQTPMRRWARLVQCGRARSSNAVSSTEWKHSYWAIGVKLEWHVEQHYDSHMWRWPPHKCFPHITSSPNVWMPTHSEIAL